MDSKDAKVIENSEGARTTPSIVGFLTMKVGRTACKKTSCNKP